MGIEPRHDFCYVAESIGYSCQLPSKTVHNRVTDAKNPCQISSNSCRCDETERNRAPMSEGWEASVSIRGAKDQSLWIPTTPSPDSFRPDHREVG